MVYQLWFSPEASRSVSSGPNIATKESNSWVRENQLEDRRRKLQRFPNSAALRGLPLVEDAGHGKAVPRWVGASGRRGRGAHTPQGCAPPGLWSPAPAMNNSPCVSPSVINQGTAVGRDKSSPCLGVSGPGEYGMSHELAQFTLCMDVVTGNHLPLFHVQFPHQHKCIIKSDIHPGLYW